MSWFYVFVGVTFVCLRTSLGKVDDHSIPCLYTGTIKTHTDWHGFIANISIMDSGRMTFEFTYPADKCCESVLFYLEDQINVINPRMNCWQKESFLEHESDQILRLTPRFTWSGCHMVHIQGTSTYQCRGGRSFTSANGRTKPTRWFVAVSNCSGFRGLELQYHLEVFGHIGECKTLGKPANIPYKSAMPAIAAPVSSRIADKHCVIEGKMNTSSNWYGFIANVTLAAEGEFNFKVSFPFGEQSVNILLYNDDDLVLLPTAQSCYQRIGVIPKDQLNERKIDLSYSASWNGCVTRNTDEGRILTCEGIRRYNHPRKLYIAVSDCSRSTPRLILNYRFGLSGFENSPCSVATIFLNPLLFLVISVITLYRSLFELH